MPIIQNPETGQWEWDYNEGPYTGAPFDPNTGNPYDPSLLPPGVQPGTAENPYAYWGADGWNTGGAKQEDPTAPQAPIPSGGGDGPGSPAPNPYDTSGMENGSPSSFDISASWPTLSLPRFDPGPAFSFDQFKAPTIEEARNEPGFQFGMEQGLGALGNKLVSRGIFRTGATPKAFFDYANSAADQNYGNVYNRAQNTYQTNYGAAKGVFDSQYGQRKDKYGFDVNAAVQEFAPRQRAAELTFSDVYNRWRDQLASLTNIASAGAGA